MVWDNWRIWAVGEEAFFRPIYRLPEERDGPPQTRPGLSEVGAPPVCGQNHIHEFSCFRFLDPARLPWVAKSVLVAFAFADALHLAIRGDLEVLVEPFQSPLLRRRNIFYRRGDILRLAERQAVDTHQPQQLQQGE